VRDAGRFYPNPSPHSDTSACFRDLARSDFGFIYQILSFERTHEQTQTTASIKSNRHVSAYLSDVCAYGSLYLNSEELKSKIFDILQEYNRYLAINIFKFREPGFWNYHRGQLQELGYPLTGWVLFKSAIAVAVEAIMNPALTVGKLWKKNSLKMP
jgi:hypothetical protein